MNEELTFDEVLKLAKELAKDPEVRTKLKQLLQFRGDAAEVENLYKECEELFNKKE